MLKTVAWVFFGLAVINVFAAANTGQPPLFIGLSLSCIISGVAFLAADQALVLLTQIRDALAPQLAEQAASTTADATPQRPARSIEELQADLARLRDGKS